MSGYAELYCLSNYSFLCAASHPHELVARAAELGYAALALTDECSVAGAVRAHTAARELGLKLLIGTSVQLDDGPRLVLLAPDRRAYGQLCALISRGRGQAPKGRYRLVRADVQDAVPDCLAILVTGEATGSDEAGWFNACFKGRGWLGLTLLRDGLDMARLERSYRLSRLTGLVRVACPGVRMHRRGRRALLDTLTAIRLGQPLHELGTALASNGERCLRPREDLARLYPPELLEETLAVAARCTFSLDELRYEYPEEGIAPGHTPSSWLRELTERGARERWPQGVPERVRAMIEHELSLIGELGYEAYFLTVYDIVAYARRQGILCQGRGSAANSAVCYCLGITAVNPDESTLLFERFVSRERDEPPDIDVDFEHERREEVMQYIYRRYGRERAALAATVITYRLRSALRDVGKALGLAPDQIERLAGALQGWDGRSPADAGLREAGFSPDNPQIRRVLVMVRQVLGFPRHLSQHVGGFVISRGPLCELVPIENAAMKGRTLVQWDKDDLDALGLLKVDCLALGMLSALRRCFDLLARHRGRNLSLPAVPRDDPGVYRMIARADTVGVFQIESRAQMAMLPRLRPETFYDLVIEIAIVRPGPIQGDMVHPYLRRREGLEAVDYPSDAVRQVLERTLGVPIFQEQVMQLAVSAAGFSAGEADRLRRSMAAWKRKGGLGPFRERLLQGMRSRGYDEAWGERIFRQIEGFGEYGFPESHSASFALLAYASAWLKYHEPAAFTCALLNSQPMGFYAPSQLVRDARKHGVEVRGVDVAASDWDCTLEPAADGEVALRLGLRLIKGLSHKGATRLIAARAGRPLRDVQDMAQRAQLDRGDLKRLADAGALAALSGHRRQARWQVLGVEPGLPVFSDFRVRERPPALAAPAEGDDLVSDYGALGLSLGRHPLVLLRSRLRRHRFRTAAELWQLDSGKLVRGAGLVITRQRPGSAKGTVFITLEDETGVVNVVVWPKVVERQRRIVVSARLIGVIGTWERRGDVAHLIAGRLEDHGHLLGELVTSSRDFQ